MYSEKELALWLCSINGLELSEKHKLKYFYGDYNSLYKAVTSGNTSELFTERVRYILKQSASSFDPDVILNKLYKCGARFIFEKDAEYPEKFKNIDNSPLGFFLTGNLPDEKLPSIAVIGSRACSAYGLGMTEKLTSELVQGGVQIISGLAMGIDGASHRAALSKKGRTFGVLGNGIGSIYPKENADIYEMMIQNGGVISEYYIGSKSLPQHFPERNRLIAGLSDGVLVVEARKKSGTMITVNRCLEQGKEVFVVPGRIGDALSEGCLELIKSGASLVTNSKDIAFALKDKYPDNITYFLNDDSQYSFTAVGDVSFDSGNEKLIYSLISKEDCAIDELVMHSGLDYFTVIEIIDKLTDKKLIKETCGIYQKNYNSRLKQTGCKVKIKRFF